jgi:hypothetical protein
MKKYIAAGIIISILVIAFSSCTIYNYTRNMIHNQLNLEEHFNDAVKASWKVKLPSTSNQPSK